MVNGQLKEFKMGRRRDRRIEERRGKALRVVLSRQERKLKSDGKIKEANEISEVLDDNTLFAVVVDETFNMLIPKSDDENTPWADFFERIIKALPEILKFIAGLIKMFI